MVVRVLGRLITTVALAASVVCAVPARAQTPEETTLAVPALSLTFSSTFVAEELGLWDKEGLKVKISTVPGVGAANAVLAGSVDFCVVTAATIVRGTARGQQLFAIAQLMDRMTLETVLRKDVAEKAGITSGMPLEKRAQVVLVTVLVLAIDMGLERLQARSLAWRPLARDVGV